MQNKFFRTLVLTSSLSLLSLGINSIYSECKANPQISIDGTVSKAMVDFVENHVLAKGEKYDPTKWGFLLVLESHLYPNSQKWTYSAYANETTSIKSGDTVEVDLRNKIKDLNKVTWQKFISLQSYVSVDAIYNNERLLHVPLKNDAWQNVGKNENTWSVMDGSNFKVKNCETKIVGKSNPHLECEADVTSEQ